MYSGTLSKIVKSVSPGTVKVFLLPLKGVKLMGAGLIGPSGVMTVAVIITLVLVLELELEHAITLNRHVLAGTSVNWAICETKLQRIKIIWFSQILYL